METFKNWSGKLDKQLRPACVLPALYVTIKEITFGALYLYPMAISGLTRGIIGLLLNKS